MTFRSRAYVALAAGALLPLALLAMGIRRQLAARVAAQYARGVESLAAIVTEDVARENAAIGARLSGMVRALREDDRFRLAAVHGAPNERTYLLDYAEQAMRLAGLSMLQIQNADGRIISSGHFRNEFDRLEPELPRLLVRAPGGAALTRARTAQGPMLVLARVDSLRLAGQRFTLVGGTTVDRSLLRRLARGDELTLTLLTPDSTAPATEANPTNGRVAAEVPIPYVQTPTAGESQLASARLRITHSSSELDALRADVDRWFLTSVALAVAGALALGFWLSTYLTRPLADLARATTSINLEGPQVDIAVARDDEIGTLARRLSAMATRLRASVAKLRDAERRATVGEMARQVNHDIKNGLVPIRNVVRHLAEVQQQHPADLPGTFAERRATLESSLEYLDTLARSYARLSPRVDTRAVDANAVISDLAISLTGGDRDAPVRTRLHAHLPKVLGDPVLLRRIVDNLVRNGIESLSDGNGSVTVSSQPADGMVRIVVADTGRGMTDEELSRAFEDFYTTKAGGVGLGLSVVRRLVADMHGTLRVESFPARGTTVTLDLPTIKGSDSLIREQGV